MGQKINPVIFRLGVNKTWKTEFFEKKNNELPLYVFKDLEIKNYIENHLNLKDYKITYKEEGAIPLFYPPYKEEKNKINI
jgi:lycopene beta-cyclase